MTTTRPTNIRWRIMGILMLASFIFYTLRYNMSAAAPVMMADLGLTEIQWGWILAAFLVGYTIFQIPGGILGDRFGPRRVLTAIAVCWAVLTAITALPNGLSSTGLNIGVTVSAPFLAWSIVEFGWRTSFLFLSPSALFLAGLWWWYARDHPEDHKAVNNKEIELIQAGRTNEQSIDEQTEKTDWLRLLKNRYVLWLTASYFCMTYTFYVVFSWFFYFLVEVRQFSMTDAGFVTSAQWIAGGAGAAVSGWYCDRLCRRIGLRWGCRLPLIIGGVVSAVFSLVAALLILLVRPDRQISQ